MGEPRKQFTFYRSYYDAIQELPKKDQSALILAVCAYALYERAPTGLSPAASTAFKLIQPTLDSGRKKSVNGAQGGALSKPYSKQSESKSKANRKQNESKNEFASTSGEREKEGEKEVEVEVEYEVEVDAEGNSEAAAATAEDQRLRIMEGKLGKGVVVLSLAQIEALLDELGLDMFDRYVEKLADFIIDKGAKVQNHYATILKWWKEDQAL